MAIWRARPNPHPSNFLWTAAPEGQKPVPPHCGIYLLNWVLKAVDPKPIKSKDEHHIYAPHKRIRIFFCLLSAKLE